MTRTPTGPRTAVAFLLAAAATVAAISCSGDRGIGSGASAAEDVDASVAAL